MRALSAAELLSVWEQSYAQPLTQRALTLLAAACPDTPLDVLANFSIGQRDACLLVLREKIFGPQLVSVTACPGCGGRVEIDFEVAEVLPSPAKQENPAESAKTMMLGLDDYEVEFRLPTSADLVAIEDLTETSFAQMRLLERCLLQARRNGEGRSVEQLPVEVVEAVVQWIAEADPQADCS